MADITRILCILGNGNSRSIVKEVLSPLITKDILPWTKLDYKIISLKQETLISSISDAFYKSIGTSIFSNFDAIILANIDIFYDIFSITSLHTSKLESISLYGGSLAPQILVPKRVPVCLHLNAQSFSLAEYLQYKIPLSFTYINTSIQLDPVSVSAEKIKLGPDVSTIILGESYEKIRLENPEGIDFIYQNVESTYYNILKLFKYFQLLKNGGSTVFKINCRNPKYLEYLTIACHFFEEVNLFKPCSIDLFDPYLYVICKKYISNPGMTSYISEVLTNLEIYMGKYNLKGESVSIDNLISINNVQKLQAYVSIVISKIKELREIIAKDGKYFAPRSLIYWGLPGTPDTV
jgi:hypothetical protein